MRLESIVRMLPPPHRFHASYFLISVQFFSQVAPRKKLFKSLGRLLPAPRLSSMCVTHALHGGRSVETTQPLRAHQRIVPLVDINTHQHGKASNQNCDAAPPTRTAACHFVLACETGVVHARCCTRHRARCTHGTHGCAWHTHAPPICSSAALAAPRCRDLSSAALLCGPLGERA